MDIVIIGAIVVGLVQLFKTTFNITSRYVPITTLAVTAILFFIYMQVQNIPANWETIQDGLMVALSAMGLWSGVKATAGK